MPTDLPQRLLALWPELESAYRVANKWGGQTGIIFVSPDCQDVDPCEQVASALGWGVIKYDEAPISESDFNEHVYDFLLSPEKQLDLFESTPKSLSVIIPHIDQCGRSIWGKFKFLFEHAKLPFILLATAADERWMPNNWAGHVFVCHKSGLPEHPAQETPSPTE